MTVLKALYVRSPYYDREISPLALGINLYILADHYIKEIYCELSKFSSARFKIKLATFITNLGQ